LACSQGELPADYLLVGLLGVLFFDPEDFFAGAFVVFFAAVFFFVAIFYFLLSNKMETDFTLFPFI